MATSLAETQQDRRLLMVNTQLRTGDVVDHEVLGAFLDVPRERFVAPSCVELAYLDRDAPALGAKSRRLLRPLLLARMVQAAGVDAGERALDVGGGAGYGAAILNAMGAKVVMLESDAGAAEAARRELAGSAIDIVNGPLERGVERSAPFDVIVVEGAFGLMPDALIAQLADGGRLVGVDAIMGAPQAALFEKRGGAVSRRALFEAAADVLDGFQPGASFVF
jgi:protein-L-isoaspartate(D-aspartate) O-methyltransferase